MLRAFNRKNCGVNGVEPEKRRRQRCLREKVAVVTALKREKTALTVFNGKKSGVNGNEPEQ